MINIRERTLNAKYRLLQCEISLSLVSLNNKNEEKEIRDMFYKITDKMDTLNKSESLLKLKSSELSDTYIDELMVNTKEMEDAVELLEHKINVLLKIYNKSSNLTGEKDLPSG